MESGVHLRCGISSHTSSASEFRRSIQIHFELASYFSSTIQHHWHETSTGGNPVDIIQKSIELYNTTIKNKN